MEGQRVAKKKDGGSKLPWIVTGTVAGVLAAAYLGVCAWASEWDAILPNVSVAGIDVSNLIVEQARDKVADTLAREGKDITLTLTYEDLSESLSGSDVAADIDESVRAARQIGHENFFTGGPQLVGHMLGMSSQLPLVLPEDEPAQAALMERMEQAVNAAIGDQGYQIEGDRLVMTKGAPITSIDWAKTRDDIAEKLQSSFEERFSGKRDAVDNTVLLSASQSQRQDPDFEAIHREVYAEPADAALDLKTMEVTGHVVGVDFDVQELKRAYQAARSGETFSIPLTVTQPKVTREELEGQLFKDLLGEGTTRVSGSANRKHNVKLSAEACNGVILLPGEEFSYNNTTGSRTADKGYKNAPIYQQGLSVDDIGGGICQTSSTIYYAVLHTPLEVVERHDHQFNTGYVDMGMDATVYYGSLDFRFKNSTDYPIKIVTNSYDSNGSRYLNVQIYGTNPEGVYAVPESVYYDKVAPTTVYTPDESVPRGTLVLDRQQYAYTGWSAHTYRYIYDKDGNQLEKQDMGTSKYNMRPNTYRYNPADGDPSTWVDGKPGGTAADPGTADPGASQPADPGTAAPSEPGAGGSEEPATPQPSDSGLDPIDPNAAAG